MDWPRKGDGRRALKKRRPEARQAVCRPEAGAPPVRSTHAAARRPAEASGSAESSGSANDSGPTTTPKPGRGGRGPRGSAVSAGTARGAHSTPTRITAADAARSAKSAKKRAIRTATRGVARSAWTSTARTATAWASAAGAAMRIKASARTDDLHLTRDQAAVRSDLAINDDKMTTRLDAAAGVLDPEAA